MALWRNCRKFAYELPLQTHWMLYLKSAFVKTLLEASQLLDDSLTASFQNVLKFPIQYK